MGVPTNTPFAPTLSFQSQQLWDFSLGVALKSRRNLITAEVGLRTLEGREGLRSEVVDLVNPLSSEEGVRRGSQGNELRGSGARGRAQVLGLLLDLPGQPDRGEGPRGRGRGVSREFGENRSPLFPSTQPWRG